MAFFGDLPREKYSVTSTLSVCSLRFSLIYFLGICIFYKVRDINSISLIDSFGNEPKKEDRKSYTLKKKG